MSNTRTRAHVRGPMPAPILADPLSKNLEVATPAIDSSSDDTEDAIAITIPMSRKEKRKQKKQRLSPSLLTLSDTEKELTLEPTQNQKEPAISIPQSLTMPPGTQVAQKAYPLLVCSIGNPGSTYANTLHSAGHLLTSYIATRKQYKPFTKGLSGLVSKPDNTVLSFGLLKGYRKEEGGPPEDDFTFWQSTTLMNISGANVRKAWQEFSKQLKREGLEGRLVVVHDELESALGKVSVKDGSASAKGHNGLKSCQSSLQGIKWWRVGVGIGRPESRDPAVVSRYVLRKMTGTERNALEKSAVGVVDALRLISEGKK